MKQYCKEYKIKGLLLGVDARNAFDSGPWIHAENSTSVAK